MSGLAADYTIDHEVLLNVRALDRAPVPILIVADRPAERLALKDMLLPLRYTIVEADDAPAALRCLTAQDFAVILLDVRLPEMAGFETAALIRDHPQSAMTPIIFIAAGAKDEVASSELFVRGAVDVIFAPVPVNELRAKVSVFANLFIRVADLAERVREVQESAGRMRLLSDAAPIGIFQTDIQNRYVYTNPRWTEITGISAEAAAGRRWDTIIGSEERARLHADLPDGATDWSELSHRFEIVLPDSTRRIVLVTSRTIPDNDGGISGWIGTLANITAEAEAEAALADARDKATEASRLKSDFLANMSHEIRTPMNGVLGMTDLLLETKLDPRQRDYAQTVRNSGEALLTIVNDILDFSKVEAGAFELENVEFSMREVVGDVVALLARAAQDKGLELVQVIDSDMPAIVSGDPGRVRQVLTNLIDNAVKFTETGEVVVRVVATEIVDGTSLIRVEVSDTGLGIAAEKLALIFQPFVQGDSSTSRKYGGTGLGLSISGQLVALMGGDCGVCSTLGEGSTFWFTICVNASAGQAADRFLKPDPELAGVTALVVDDNPAQRTELSRYLAAWGMTVTTADSGPDALDALRTAALESRPIAVALVDRFMPDMDGLDVRNAIGDDPTLTTRLVLVTGFGEDATAEPGVSASLSKPIHREELRTCVRIALGLDPSVSAPKPVTPLRSTPSEREVGRLLLAEDNLINRKVAVAMLSNAGYRVDTVIDGVAAVQAAGARSYDAILMDCQLPELSGYEATAAIRAQEGSRRHTPIIAMTAGARREDRELCIAAGMDSYLAKPVTKDALLALVGRFVTGGRR